MPTTTNRQTLPYPSPPYRGDCEREGPSASPLWRVAQSTPMQIVNTLPSSNSRHCATADYSPVTTFAKWYISTYRLSNKGGYCSCCSREQQCRQSIECSGVAGHMGLCRTVELPGKAGRGIDNLEAESKVERLRRPICRPGGQPAAKTPLSAELRKGMVHEEPPDAAPPHAFMHIKAPDITPKRTASGLSETRVNRL